MNLKQIITKAKDCFPSIFGVSDTRYSKLIANEQYLNKEMADLQQTLYVMGYRDYSKNFILRDIGCQTIRYRKRSLSPINKDLQQYYLTKHMLLVKRRFNDLLQSK